MKNTKIKYEEINVELIYLTKSDVITTSGPFDGEDDEVGNNWG